MKLLGLLRHAQSDWSAGVLRDFDRRLTDKGQRGAALMGAHIRNYGAPWEMVIASPAERVRDTLDVMEFPSAVRWEPRAYLADDAMLMELLRGIPDAFDSLLLAGHNPGLQDLIFRLGGSAEDGDLFDIVAEKYPTATFAVLELAIDRWADCVPGCGRLVHVARPRDLDASLGPVRIG